MYHNISPDPHHSRGYERADNGVVHFALLIRDTIVDRTYNPDVAIAFSEGSKVEDEAKSLCPILLRGQSTPDDNEDDDEDDDEPKSEWCRITAKTQEQLDKEFNGGETAWTREDLRLNLVEQHKHFSKHKAGDEDDEYAQLMKKMLKMCHVY